MQEESKHFATSFGPLPLLLFAVLKTNKQTKIRIITKIFKEIKKGIEKRRQNKKIPVKLEKVNKFVKSKHLNNTKIKRVMGILFSFTECFVYYLKYYLVFININ